MVGNTGRIFEAQEGNWTKRGPRKNRRFDLGASFGGDLLKTILRVLLHLEGVSANAIVTVGANATVMQVCM